MLCAGALFMSLCQFLRDSCRLGDHTSIMYPAGEGAQAGAISGEIKEVIHPFYTHPQAGEDCAYRLWPWPENREKRGGREGERTGELRAKRVIAQLQGMELSNHPSRALSHSSHHSWRFHKGQFVHQRIPRRLEASASWDGGRLRWGCWVEQNSSHLTTGSILWLQLAMVFATLKRSEVRLAGGAPPGRPE